jgi:hypothetical protein
MKKPGKVYVEDIRVECTDRGEHGLFVEIEDTSEGGEGSLYLTPAEAEDIIEHLMDFVMWARSKDRASSR